MLLAERAELVRQQMATALRSQGADAASVSTVKQFARVLRRRWGGRYGCLRTSEPMTLQEEREEAPMYTYTYVWALLAAGLQGSL